MRTDRVISMLLIFIALWAACAFGQAPPSKLPPDLDTLRAGNETALQHRAREGGGKEGGEDIANAVIIPSLPFADTGNTCDNVDDYDEVCPFPDSDSPDVVYAYTPATDIRVDIDLCASTYDTKVYVYMNTYTPGDPLYCNEDRCGDDGYKSLLSGLCLAGGNTYYIVVDGYGGDCGDYALTVDAAGRVWYVPADAPTIQAGIDSACAGDTVIVACGTYYEHDIIMKSGIALISEDCGKGGAVIDAQGQGRVIYCENLDTATIIQGFTLTGGDAFPSPNSNRGGGMYCVGSSTTIAECEIRSNVGQYGGGISCCEGSHPQISGCTVSENEADYGGGMYCIGADLAMDGCVVANNTAVQVGGGMYWNGSSPIITGCTICQNDANSGGAGLAATNFSSVTLEQAVIAFNTGPGGEAIFCEGGGHAMFTCCDVYGNDGGDWVGCIAGQEGTNANFSGDPLFCDPDNGDFTLEAFSPCVNAPGCGLVGALGVGCSSADCQGIPLTEGWNCVSSYIDPVDPDMATVCADLIAANHLSIVKDDCSGEFCIPGMICDIDWNPHSCIMAYLSAPDLLSVCGTVMPEQGPLPLETGWNCLPFLPRSSQPPHAALAGCWDHLNILKSNCTGEFCIPDLICTIDQMKPGECYMAHFADPCDLHYPPTRGEARRDVARFEVPEPRHFTGLKGTGATYNIVVRDPEGTLRRGDEVGVFHDDLCVGAGMWTGGPVLGITVWGDDVSTEIVDGCVDGDVLDYRVWDAGASEEYAVGAEYVVGDGTYGAEPYALIRLHGAATDVDGETLETAFLDRLSQNVPNPFNPETVISYNLSKPGRVVLQVFDVEGKRVRVLADRVETAGKHSVGWDGRDHSGKKVSPGIYFYRIETDGFNSIKKMILVK